MHGSDGIREFAAYDVVRSLVNRVTVAKETVAITIDRAALSSMIGARGDDLILSDDGYTDRNHRCSQMPAQR